MRERGSSLEHDDAARHLIGSQLPPREGQQRIRINGVPRSRDDGGGGGDDIFAPAGPGQADHETSASPGKPARTSSASVGEMLNPPVMMSSLIRSRIVTKWPLSTGDDVAGAEPAALEEGVFGFLRPVPVPREYLGAADEQFVFLTGGAVKGDVLRVHHADVGEGEGPATVPGFRLAPIGFPSAMGDVSVSP
ncbi:hypothetical protein QFZ79_001725 [Arthrobacter sp. V4I6]|nr:hypothetical protein [Arthrobacter sp. V1I7]MDQ0853614.1 hypothetical protein [Arthrobacter sp. V4I6]